MFRSKIPIGLVRRGEIIILSICAAALIGCAPNWHGRGLEATGRGEHMEAVRFYQAHLKQYPDDLRARNDLGVSYLRSGQYDLAFWSFKRFSLPTRNTSVPITMSL